MKTRTITALLKDDNYIFVRLKGENVRRRFLQEAEKEGFTYSDGTSPTETDGDDIMAIHSDMTLSYVGYISRLAYKNVKIKGDKKIVRIDYVKYIAGAERYVIKRKEAIAEQPGI